MWYVGMQSDLVRHRRRRLGGHDEALQSAFMAALGLVGIKQVYTTVNIEANIQTKWKR
jgi:hypothetical protein